MPLPLNSFPTDPAAALMPGISATPSNASAAVVGTGEVPEGTSFDTLLAENTGEGCDIAEFPSGESSDAPVVANADQLLMMMAFMVAPQPPPAPVKLTVPSADADLGLNISPAVADANCASDLPQTDFGKVNFFPNSVAPKQFAPVAGKSASQQLAEGAPVIEFQLQAAPGETTAVGQPTKTISPGSASIAAGAEKIVDDGKVAPLAELSGLNFAPSVTVAAPADSQLTAVVAPASVQAALQQSNDSIQAAIRMPAVERPVRTEKGANAIPQKGEAKNAARATVGTSNPASGGIPSVYLRKNNFLSVDNKELTIDTTQVGMSGANRESTMFASSHFKPDFASAGAVLSVDAGGSLLQVEKGLQADNLQPAPVHAAEAIRTIREIADDLWAAPRNSVEVRFNFGENEHLSVKVECRDGAVHATFHTNSPELRDTLSREWQLQASVAEARPYRLVDPVFTASAPSSDAQGQFAAGRDDGRQQQHFSGQSPASFNQSWASSSRQSAATVSDVAAPVSLSRPDTALHLHVLA